MADPFTQLSEWQLADGYVSNVNRGEGGDSMAPGSENGMATGAGVRAFRGPLLLAGKLGSRVLFNTDQSYAGLGTGAVDGFGSVFNIRQLLSYLGSGQVNFNGAALAGIIASSTLSLLKKFAGAYVAGPTTGPFQAGEAQPSAPSIYPKSSPSAGKPAMTGAIVVAIHRVSAITGQVSLVSLPSNILVLSGQTPIVQMPLVDANGQTHWGIDVPKIGFAELGVLYELPISLSGEVAEADLAYTRALGASSAIVRGLTGASNATPIVITDNAHPFVTGDQVVIAGVTGNVGANGSFVVTVLTANTYSLNGSAGTGAYAAGGTVGTAIADAAGGAFVPADVGRRVDIGAFSSWITSITSGTRVRTNDVNATGATITAAGLVTHAIDGYTRAVEISWSNSALFGQDLAPRKAFPPAAAQFAGVMNDTVWLDADGIIYIGEPGQVGSFPPKNAVFANEPAVLYLKAGKVTARWGKTSLGFLYYVGGSPAIEYQTWWDNQGLLLPQNSALGFKGRILAWLGKPTMISETIEADFDYSNAVTPDFRGWAESQTAAQPIVVGYDGVGQYECWCFKKVIRAKHGPTGRWCSKLDLTGKINGNIMSAVTVNVQGVGHVLYLSCANGAALDLYQFDAGTGSVMKILTSSVSRISRGTDVTLVMAEGSVDNINHPAVIEVVRDFDDDNPVPDPLTGNPLQTPAAPGPRPFYPREPNVIDTFAHAVKLTLTSEVSADHQTTVTRIVTFGSTSDVLKR